MLIGVSYSNEKDSEAAAKLAVKQAIDESDEPVITFLFTTDNYNQDKIFDVVKENIGESKLIGACTPGIITRDGVLKNCVGVCTISGKITAATHLQERINSWRDGVLAGESLRNSEIYSGTVFAFPDGFAENISDILRGLYSPLGPNFVYLGGGSGDNLKFLRTYQFTDRGVSSGALAIAVIDGIKFSAGVGHGWRPIGYPMVVTRAAGKVIYEIDGRPAFDVYSECLGGVNKEDFPVYGMKYPLGLPYSYGKFLIRDPIEVKEDNSIEFVTEVPQNSVVTLMEGAADELISTAEQVASVAMEGVKCPEVALIFDCVSRYLLLGKKFEKELEVVRKTIGDTPMLGMLTFGEIHSFHSVPLFHNKTIIVAVGGR